jgi:hypothetical protein
MKALTCSGRKLVHYNSLKLAVELLVHYISLTNQIGDRHRAANVNSEISAMLSH